MIDFTSPRQVARLIDQTLLNPTAERHQVRQFCEEAAALAFAAVCVAPCWVSLAAALLKGTRTRVCTVAGFPLGFDPVEIKVKAAQTAIAAGADEIDYVVNLGAVKGGDRDLVAAEMQAMRLATQNAVLKIILETGYLSEQEKKWLCCLAVDQKLDFVKTSTGLGPTGATAADVRLLVECGRAQIRVKAAGGIRRIQELRQMVLAGAQRIGTSVGSEIMAQITERQSRRGRKD